MDKICDRNPSKSEVIGRCGRDEKPEWPRRTDKSRTLKKIKNKIIIYIVVYNAYPLYNTLYIDNECRSVNLIAIEPCILCASSYLCLSFAQLCNLQNTL